MTSTKSLGLLAVALCANIVASADAAIVDFTFDGTTTGGWTLVNRITEKTVDKITPVAAFSGMNGLRFHDKNFGTSYYSAPAAILGDLSGTTFNFGYQINSGFNHPLLGFADLYVNGSPVPGVDLFDETILDTVQSVSIDFSSPEFLGVDVANVSSLYIKAEWWGDNIQPSIESYLLGTAVPEPGCSAMLIAGLLGTAGFVRRRKTSA